MAIYVTGDTHGDIDIHKLSSKNLNDRSINLTENDYLIVCGDFGLVWDNSNTDMHWRKWLNCKPWTTLWIDGNHENFDLLNEFSEEDWNGGKIHRIESKILHLCRGYVFNIDGQSIFAFGGAASTDKNLRIEGVSWWPQEMPNKEEYDRGIESLKKCNWTVDYVITHCLPAGIQTEIFYNSGYASNELTRYFGNIEYNLKYKKWYSGHYHVDREYKRKFKCIYNDIVEIGKGDFVNLWN